jgi:hypothetical protein
MSGPIVPSTSNATVPVSSAVSEIQRVEPLAKRYKGQSISIPAEQAVAKDGKPMVTQVIMTPAPSVDALNQTSYFSFYLERDSMGVVDEGVLRFALRFNVTSGASDAPSPSVKDNSLLPITQWFERIEWYDRHTGQEIVRYHGDIQHLMWQTIPKDVQQYWVDKMSYCKHLNGAASGKQHYDGEERYYFFPLTLNWFEGHDLDLSVLRGDLEIRFYPRGNIFNQVQDTKVNGGTSVQLQEIRFLDQTRMFTPAARYQHRQNKSSKTYQRNYLDFQEYRLTQRVMGSNTEYTFDLDQFHNDSPALILLLRKIGKYNPRTNADDLPIDQGEGLLTYGSIGAKGTLDHENVHGRSLIGDGTPIDEQFWKTWTMPNWVHESFYNSHTPYIIPFSNDLPGVLSAVVDGYHEFRGDRERIRIRTGPPKRDSWQIYGLSSMSNTNGNGATFFVNHVAQTAAAEATNLITEISVLLDGIIIGTAYVSSLTGATATKPIEIASSSIEVNPSDPLLLDHLQRCCQLNEYAKCQGMKLSFETTSDAGRGFKTFGSGNNAPGQSILTESQRPEIKVTATNFEDQPIECEGWSDRIVFKLKLNPVVENAPPASGTYPLRYAHELSGTASTQGVFGGAYADVSLVPIGASQVGQCGFDDGTYEPVIYCIYYRHLKETQGRIVVDDM